MALHTHVPTITFFLLALSWLASPGLGGEQADMRRTVVEKVEIRNAPVVGAVVAIQRQSAVSDPRGRGMQVIWAGGSRSRATKANRRVTLSLRNISLEGAIRCVCLVSGLYFWVTEHFVVISDRPPPLETRFYGIDAGVVDAVKTRQRPESLGGVDDDD